MTREKSQCTFLLDIGFQKPGIYADSGFVESNGKNKFVVGFFL
jgi:hypothetical protein